MKNKILIFLFIVLTQLVLIPTEIKSEDSISWSSLSNSRTSVSNRSNSSRYGQNVLYYTKDKPVNKTLKKKKKSVSFHEMVKMIRAQKKNSANKPPS
jgi:hypothetical protein